MTNSSWLLRVMAVIVLGVACNGTTATSAQRASESANADTGRLLWSALQCSVYAEMSQKPQEQERLFRLGYDNGKRFIDGVRSKTIGESEINEVPIGVLSAMAGPTTEFVLGRIYEAAMQDAYDRVEKKDPAGKDTPIQEWVLEKDVLAIRAGTEYLVRNCALLR